MPRCVHVLPSLVLLTSSLFALPLAAAQPDPAKTRAYIDKAWVTLTRSMQDCSAFGDEKVTTRPVLYLPADFPLNEEIAQIRERCQVEVQHLPQPISRLGEFDPATLPRQGLLYVPHPYVVPGGFFNEMYGWDSYFIVLGLVVDGQGQLARHMVDNMLFEVEHYGAVLNANRSYYLSRSQPPFLAEMIREVLDAPDAFADRAEADAWLARAYPIAVRDHAIWLQPDHRAGDTGLARYYDYGQGPVLEMRDGKYLRGVIDWLLDHPQRDPGFLITASENPDAAEAARLQASSCDVQASAVCRQAWSRGHRLTADFYRGDRAMRESGFDVNFHFGPFAGATHHYAPVCLNSLLYRYESGLADLAARLGREADASAHREQAAQRKQAIDRYLWSEQDGSYHDYDFMQGERNAAPYISAFYPLWAGAASPAQARAMQQQIAALERKGGLAMSADTSGAQWDAPYGWAPTNWLAIEGLRANGYIDDARRLAGKFSATIDRALAHDGTIREKYNMDTGDATVNISAGYSDNVIGFGWSNGVYLRLQPLLSAPVTAR